MNGRSIRWISAAAAGAAAIGALSMFWGENTGRPPPAAAPAPRAGERSPVAAAGAPPPLPIHRAEPASWTPDEAEERRRIRVEQTRRARAAYRQYPPYSRPLRESPELLVPNQVPPVERPLAGPGQSSSDSRIRVRQTQDRVYVQEGTTTAVGLEAVSDGQPAAVQVVSAELVTSVASTAPLATVGFTSAGGAASATFVPPSDQLASYSGDLLLRVEARVGEEQGTLIYAFVYTGAAPATFTGVTGDRLEEGSVTFTAGVEVVKTGRYRITGRIDDANGTALALAQYDGTLRSGRQEVPLVLFGKIAHEESAVSPFVLRDLEGFLLLDGVHPDRQVMQTWPGPYRSQTYALDTLSASAWKEDGQ